MSLSTTRAGRLILQPLREKIMQEDVLPLVSRSLLTEHYLLTIINWPTTVLGAYWCLQSRGDVWPGVI